MKALIYDDTAFIVTPEKSHSQLVKEAFLEAYSSGEIDVRLFSESATLSLCITYAKANDYDAIIYSYEGEESYFSLAESNPDIMIFMPSDNYTGNLQQLVLTDLLPTIDDAEFTDNTQSAQSYSNSKIVGQLFYIASQRSCSLSEARICANATKSEDGIIDLNAAIVYSGEIKLTIGTLTAVREAGFSSTLTLERVIDATNYTIEVKDVEEIETTSLSNAYTLPDYDIYYFRYKGYNADLESGWSEWQVIPYPAIKHLIYRT